MASSGKKTKTKWKHMQLCDVIDNSLTLPCKSGWAEEVEDYNDRDYSRKVDKVQLPTAPRASRAHEDDSNIPQDPPYMAYLTNLPYDVNEDELNNFFQEMKVNVKKVLLPKEDRGNRFRGYGYVEFDDRASFVSVLTLSDTMIKGRRMRIEVSTNHGDSRGGRGMRGNNPEPDYINQDWRSGPPREQRNDDDGYRSGSRRDYGDRGGGGGYGRRDDRRGGYGDRDRDRSYRDRGFGNRDREGDSNREWVRDGERWRDDNRDRGSFGGRSGGGSSSGGGGGAGGGYDDRRNEYVNWRRDMDHERDRDPPERSEPKTRPKIALQPRTVPLETDNKETETSSASIFGGAKPVNTAAREREIEERLARQSAAVDEAPKRRGPPSQESWDRDRDRGRGERDKDRGRDRDRSDDKEKYKGGDRDQDRDQEYREKEYDRDDEEDTYSKDRDYDSDERDSSRLSSRDDDDENPRKEKEPAPPPKENPWTRRSQQSASSNVNNGRVSPSSEDAESRPKSRGASPRPPTREESSSNDSVRKYQPPRGQSNDQKRGERKSSGGDDRNRGGSSTGRGGSNSSAGPAKGSTQGSARSRDAKKEDRDEVLRMPKFQEQKAPNFAGSNKYAFLEESSETAAN